jgi:hypothetical protein
LQQEILGLVVLLGLLASSATFARETWRRNAEWKNERTLFESALRVCPTSLKVLNNLSMKLLNGDATDAR